MKEQQLEPGLLQTFRIYAGLRILLLVISIGSQNFFFKEHPKNIEVENYGLLTGLIFISMLALGIYLYSDGLKRKLGKVYLPLALFFATASLILEQLWLSPAANLWQPDSFFFVLLIFVAWQYDFKIVLLFTIVILGTEFFLIPAQPYGMGERAQGMDEIGFRMVSTGRLIARSLSSLVLGFIITRLVQAQREQRKSLQNTNQLLVQHAATSEQLVISHERNRISRELHDTLAHTLSGMTVQLDAVLGVWKDIPVKSKELLEQLLNTSRTGLEETRRALQDLRSSPLEDLGLALAIRSMAEDTAARNALTAQIEIPDPIRGLSPQAEQSFYRIAQESLENIVRHAHAQSFNISVEESAEAITLSISDDGTGFALNKIPPGKLGLQGMHERAEIIGGELSIASSPTFGTSIILRKELNT